MAKIIGITEQEKTKLIKLRDAAITALAKFCDALDASFGDDVQAPVAKKTKRAKKTTQEPEVVSKAVEAPKAPVSHPGMKVIKAKGNGAAHEGLAEL